MSNGKGEGEPLTDGVGTSEFSLQVLRYSEDPIGSKRASNRSCKEYLNAALSEVVIFLCTDI